jgi:uncharacterized protein involved in exopolysaccharide biosynthesis
MIASPKVSASSPAALDDTDRLIEGVFEPPSGFAMTAIARHKWSVCAIAILLAILGAGYGYARHRTFTTSATLQVGQVNPNSPGFYGYVQSTASLATSFARAIDAEPVLQTVEHKFGLTPARAVARLSSSPIPVSPAFRVIATGPTERSAVELANTAASAVIEYESTSNSTDPAAATLLREYQQAAGALRTAEVADGRLGHGKKASIQALAAAEAQKTAAAAKLRALGVAYTNAITSQGPSSGLVTLVAGATTASSDRSAKVQLLGFIGLLAGIVLGCGLAVARERRRGMARGAGAIKAGVRTAEPS